MSTTPTELTAEQGAALTAIDDAIADIRDAFRDFREAADACEQAGVPEPIVLGKAQEFQQTIMQAMQP